MGTVMEEGNTHLLVDEKVMTIYKVFENLV